MWPVVLAFLVFHLTSRSSVLGAEDNQLAQEYLDESELQNLFEDSLISVDDSIKAASWERKGRCHFPYANRTFQFARIREGLWIPLAYLRPSDNHLHPFVSPYGPLRCLRVMSHYEPTTGWLALTYGCAPNLTSPFQWNYRFEFLPNKRIFYRDRYGCHRRRRLQRTVIADTDYDSYLLLHGCQSNFQKLVRANGLMVLVRSLDVDWKVQRAIQSYTHQVVHPNTKLIYWNDSTSEDECQCAEAAQSFVFCDPKYRFRRDPDRVERINPLYYRLIVIVNAIALLMTVLVLTELLQTYRSTMEEGKLPFID